jgi:exoribonuclease R
MKTPFNNDEQPSEEWKKLKQFVVSSNSRNTTPNMDEEFEQSVVTRILVSSLAPVSAPDNFEEEVMRRIAAEAEPTINPATGWERIASALRTRTAAVIGIVALVSGGTLSIYTLSQNHVAQVAPIKQNTEQEINISPIQAQPNVKIEKQIPQQRAKNPTVKPDSNKLPIPGNKTQQSQDSKPDDDLF